MERSPSEPDAERESEPAPSSGVDVLRRLHRTLDRGARPSELEDAELLELPRLYRGACSAAARLEARAGDASRAARARHLVARAHAQLFDLRALERESPWARLRRLFVESAPRAIRAEWRLLGLSFALLYGLAIVGGIAVSRNLDLAPSLLDPRVVAAEIEQLQETADGEPFRGNFTFGWGESPTTAGMVMLNNIWVGLLFFASALIPPLYLYVLAMNALMLGTYTAVAGHWGQAGAISSVLWCHGVLEIQAIVLAGTAGLVLVRAWVRPGAVTRRHALLVESRRALVLLAPTVPILIVAGLIEGFVSPHAPPGVRIGVAVATGVALLAWALGAGRSPRSVAAGASSS